ncbi:MAG: hypothetical protein HQK59_14260 [Deltaproteobacteria bacterium]|nr:hypothetical protein [Deltaproteobacteria bacterium]
MKALQFKPRQPGQYKENTLPIYVLCGTCGCLTELTDSFWTSQNEFHCRDCGPIFWVNAEKAMPSWPENPENQLDYSLSSRFAPLYDPGKRDDRLIAGQLSAVVGRDAS